MPSEFLSAAGRGDLPRVQSLMREGGASITETDEFGSTALLRAAMFGRVPTVAWLLEHGGADIADVAGAGITAWSLLQRRFANSDEDDADSAAVTALLRVMVLRGAPPVTMAARLAPEHARVVEEGARLRAALPAHLARRRALLDAHCPLIAPLRAMVHGYDEPTTTEELWATGLGKDP